VAKFRQAPGVDIWIYMKSIFTPKQVSFEPGTPGLTVQIEAKEILPRLCICFQVGGDRSGLTGE